MKVLVLLLLVAAAIAQQSAEDDRDKRQTQTYFGQPPRGSGVTTGAQQQRFSSFGSTPQGFRSPLDDDDVIARNTVTPTPRPQSTRRPTPPADQVRDYQHTAPQYRPQPQQQQQQQQQRRPAGAPQRGYPTQQQLLEEEEEALEEEKPDRLTLLLPQSKFDCSAKQTGYYADDGLGCEVFHYCQDNAKHSWICPEGFVFHQVHLICMPPSGDNICAQSSQYHFVNEYLYRPINSEEHLQKPNISLRYADRYYPENYYDGQLDEPQPQRQAPAAPVQHQQQQQQHQQVRRPIPHAQQLVRPQQQQQQVVRTQQQYIQSTARPYNAQQQVQRHPVQQAPAQFLRPQSNQVFHSPEEVNIPLQHRRATPPPRNTFQQRDDEEDEDEEYEYEDPAPHRQG